METPLSIGLVQLGPVVENGSRAAALVAALGPALFFLAGEAPPGRLVYRATPPLPVVGGPEKFPPLVNGLGVGLDTGLPVHRPWQNPVPPVAWQGSLGLVWVVVSLGVLPFRFGEKLGIRSPLNPPPLAGGWTVLPV